LRKLLENFEENIPKEKMYRNDLNMKFEWGWLPDGDPADTRLQEYYGLIEF